MNFKCRRLKGVTVLVILLILPSGAWAGEELSPGKIAGELQQTYEQTRTITADFRQKASVTGMPDRERTGRGTVKIKKPGQIRWDYEVPGTQVLVSDGEKFSLYQAEEKQMIVTSAEQYLGEDVIYSFFNGSGNLLEDFRIGSAPEDMRTSATHTLELIPKESHPQVEKLYLWCDRETYIIKRLRIIDPMGGFTDLKFSNIAVNQPVSEEIFSFTPPPDTEIIKDLE